MNPARQAFVLIAVGLRCGNEANILCPRPLVIDREAAAKILCLHLLF